MTVTGIVKFSESKRKIYIDQEFAFVLYKGDIHKYGLEEDKELTEEVFEEIYTVLLPKRAKLRAMNLLKSRDYTAHQLQVKLLQGLYPPEIVGQAVEYVKSFRYVDDERYATAFIRSNNVRKSRKRMTQDLLQKGISKEVVEKALQICEEDHDIVDEDRQIALLLEKKGFNRETADQKELQRIYGFLMRKGFSQENVYRAIFP